MSLTEKLKKLYLDKIFLECRGLGLTDLKGRTMSLIRYMALTSVVALVGVAGAPAWAAGGERASEVNAAGQKKEDVRKQKDGLLPPKEALDQKDTDIAPDAYQPHGYEMGSFLLFPKMEIDVTGNSNIYATSTDTKYDTITTYRPEMMLKSRFDQHEIAATVRGERKEYNIHDRESVTNSFASLSGRYDFNKADNASILLSYVKDHENRGSLDDAGGLRPTEYQYLTANPSVTVNLGDLKSTVALLAVNRNIDDTPTSAGVEPSHFRNRNEYELSLRESYEFIPGYSWVGEGTYQQRRYRHEQDQHGRQRDSDGYRVSTGIGLDVSELIRGDFQLGYMERDYEDRTFSDPSGYYARAQFNWMPTKLTTVLPTVERSIDETTAVGASSVIRTAFSTEIRHELQRNVILGSNLSYEINDQQGGTNLESQIFAASVRGTYLFNENLYSSVELGQKRKIASLPSSGFNQTTGMVRLGIQY